MIPENFKEQYQKYDALKNLGKAFQSKPNDSNVRDAITQVGEVDGSLVYGAAPDLVDGILKERTSNAQNTLVETTKSNLESLLAEAASNIDEGLVASYLLSLSSYEGKDPKYKAIGDAINDVKKASEVAESKNIKEISDYIKESTGLDNSIERYVIGDPERIERVYKGIVSMKIRKLIQTVSDEKGINRRLLKSYAKEVGIEDKPESYIRLADLVYSTIKEE